MSLTSLAGPCGGLSRPHRPHRPVRRSLTPAFATSKEAEAVPASSGAPKVGQRMFLFSSVGHATIVFPPFLPSTLSESR